MPIARFILSFMIASILICLVIVAITSAIGYRLNGYELAYVDNQFNLLVLDVEHKLTINLSSGLYISRFSWSTDGQFIAFGAGLDYGATTEQIYIVNMQGDITQLTTEGAQGGNANPLWSPDGRQIAFETITRNQCAIYLIDVDNHEPRLLIQGLCTNDFSFASDGIHFGYGTQVRRLDTLEVVYDTNETHPIWSPDGQYIIFERYAGGSQVYIARVDGSDERFISDGVSARWLPDGRIIFSQRFYEGTAIRSELWVSDLSGEHMTQMPFNDYVVSGDLSSDGQRWALPVASENLFHYIRILDFNGTQLASMPYETRTPRFAWRP